MDIKATAPKLNVTSIEAIRLAEQHLRLAQIRGRALKPVVLASLPVICLVLAASSLRVAFNRNKAVLRPPSIALLHTLTSLAPPLCTSVL